MAVTVLFAALPTADFRTALPWYERLMGRPPDRSRTTTITDPEGNTIAFAEVRGAERDR